MNTKSGSTDPFLLLDPECTQPSLWPIPHSRLGEGGTGAQAAGHLVRKEFWLAVADARGAPPSAGSLPWCLAAATALVLTAANLQPSSPQLQTSISLPPSSPSARPRFLRLGILSKHRLSSYFQRTSNWTNSQDPGNRVSQGHVGKLRGIALIFER